MTVVEKPITVAAFEQFLALPENQDRLLELIHGEMIEKMPTEEHGMIASNINIILGSFVKKTKAGRVGIEVRYQSTADQLNARLPDISFSRAQRPVIKRGGVPELPDLAIEIKSPDDTVRHLREKADYYLAHGVQQVWLVYPEQQMVEVYTLDGDVDLLFVGDQITGGELLPDFAMPVAEIFADPLAD